MERNVIWFVRDRGISLILFFSHVHIHMVFIIVIFHTSTNMTIKHMTAYVEWTLGLAEAREFINIGTRKVKYFPLSWLIIWPISYLIYLRPKIRPRIFKDIKNCFLISFTAARFTVPYAVAFLQFWSLNCCSGLYFIKITMIG